MHILVLYGSYRSDRVGIRLAHHLVRAIEATGHHGELIDAKAVNLPMLDRMYKEYPKGEAPTAMQELADKIIAADAFLVVAGEYNWGLQPGLKNLTDHFLEEWFWRPAAIASYSAGPLSGTRASYAWRNTLGEMGMIVVSSTLTVGSLGTLMNEAGDLQGEAGEKLGHRIPRFLDDLLWWAEAARNQRGRKDPPY